MFAGVWVVTAGLLCGATPGEPVAVDGPPEVIVVFRDGDRARGRIMLETASEVTLASARFGTVVVSRADIAAVEMEDSGSTRGAANGGAPAELSVATEPSDTQAQTGALMQWLRRWTASLAIAAEGKREGSKRASLMIEGRLGRKWESTELRLGGRYEVGREGERTTDDLLTFEAYARHDMRQTWFVLFSPEIEWNRGYVHAGQPLEYVWLKQQIGAGFNAIDREALKLRAGVAENLFNVWAIDRDASLSTNTESLFAELEWQLPYAIKVSDRFAWYYSIRTGEDGFENRFDLSKQLTENLHIGFRHEAREQIPNTDVSDYTLWRVLLGLDF